jgi:hypothetical protein
MIKIAGKSSKRNPTQKVWGKLLSGVDPEQRGGFCFAGEWLPKDGHAIEHEGAEGQLILLAVQRGTVRFWLIRCSSEGRIDDSQWEGVAEGTGTLLYSGDDSSQAVAAAIAAGCPQVKVSVAERTLPRQGRAVGTCGYTGKTRYRQGICEHCGDDC